ncbi:hypothetical protein, partial [Rectinema subterraneum]|uniref:hypothetical protein n=1 Tax=Rectinema subterraneum TaxID=2653714 RepID=UPI001C92F498
MEELGCWNKAEIYEICIACVVLPTLCQMGTAARTPKPAPLSSLSSLQMRETSASFFLHSR